MIIADKKKAIFIHIEKTGGRSITKLLAPYISEKYRQKNSRMPGSGRGWGPTWHINPQHSRFSESLPILDNFNIKPQEYFKFAIVRNPYSRLLSVWLNKYRSPMDVHQTITNKLRFQIAKHTGIKKFPSQHFYEIYPDGSFKNFVLFIDYIVTNYSTEIARRYIGATDQYSYIENDRNLEFDLIGKLENINLDLAAINDQLQLTKGYEIPHLNKNDQSKNKKKFLEFYDDESIEIVNRLFVRDFKTFGYERLSSVAESQESQPKIGENISSREESFR
ncbi:sulfotransferase family 2 domain-containing protein [Waterburya agarophytonicola K14]|uniref:Sulfotransferase family 2 domain-containing protein n=1 Tax=Waterburya agarophytonicola KI4 TaxID=2874699 RepID=A0A964BNZ5_9CYAN|nr:sulfotransferase family 2 domain-containing protein [Waterburya agarophytonicola]MCC0176151.1 sulfotransferase family 2 domain-containing protein [Waterburya agarophytonicola KI4]